MVGFESCCPSHSGKVILSRSDRGVGISLAQSETYDSHANPMIESEKQAFYSVLEALVGEWNPSNLYPDPCGLTPIPGASCDQYGNFWYITALNFGAVYDNSPKCSKDAILHPSIFNLTRLKTLSFYKCFMNAPQVMPVKYWSNLAGSLQSLTFQNNIALVGELSPEIAMLTNLEFLIIMENSMKGKLPLEFGKLTKLKKLVLSHNQFYGAVPDSFGCLEKLLILDLSFNALQGPIPTNLGNLSSLVKMDLSDNGLQAGIPRELGKLKSLTLLDLRNNQLHGNLPNSLTDMGSLQELYLGNNPMGGSISSLDWCNLDFLISLDLSGSNYIGSIPESFGQLKMLRSLALNDNNLSGKVPSKLADLPNVCSLLLNGNNLSGPVEFPSRFYQRMGRYLALWGNPSLCYIAETRNFVPEGVNLCSGMITSGKSHKALMNSVVGSGARISRLRQWVLLFAASLAELFLVYLPKDFGLVLETVGCIPEITSSARHHQRQDLTLALQLPPSSLSSSNWSKWNIILCLPQETIDQKHKSDCVGNNDSAQNEVMNARQVLGRVYGVVSDESVDLYRQRLKSTRRFVKILRKVTGHLVDRTSTGEIRSNSQLLTIAFVLAKGLRAFKL
eukprot:Gb_02935 [translate_table: standard]